MLTGDLASAVAELAAAADSSDARCLHRLTEIAAIQLAGCSGATATLWRDGEPLVSVASHPDLAELVETQLRVGAGPMFGALADARPVDCQDVLASWELPESDRPWPDYLASALAAGVRCSATRALSVSGSVLTLTLYGTRPGALDSAALTLSSVLAAVGTASLASASEHDGARRTAAQLAESLAARAVVDQAKGLLMHARGCDADTAFAQLRELSQTRHKKVSEIARMLLEEHAQASEKGG